MSTTVSPDENTVTALSSVGAKGRVLIPVELRRAAQWEEGDEVVMRVQGPGSIVIESRRSIRDRVWEGAPTSAQGAVGNDIRAELRLDAEMAEANLSRRSSEHYPEAEANGERLLQFLGVDPRE
jgi:bifunctional DNA-binding transcriptional regulator/antitoxin component of YhaV-PrlF toxin-antitoxin module